MKFQARAQQEKTELSMTSMIDIVFLLLVFFVMTFKISAQEGDFNIRMPKQGSGAPADSTQLPMKLMLVSDGSGTLTKIVLNDNLDFGTDWKKLRGYVRSSVGGDLGPSEDEGPEMEIDFDYDLHYIHVVNAITAVTGYRDGDDVVKLIDRIKLAPNQE